jgi:hypothetical protein
MTTSPEAPQKSPETPQLVEILDFSTDSHRFCHPTKKEQVINQ